MDVFLSLRKHGFDLLLRSLLLVSLFLILESWTPVFAHSALEPALVLLKVNQVEKQQIFIFLKGKDALVLVSDLKKAGIRGFKGIRKIIQGRRYVSLLSLFPEIKFKLHVQRAELSLWAEPSLLGMSSHTMRYQGFPPVKISPTSSFFFNYALQSQNFNQETFFGEAGYSLNNSLLYSSLIQGPHGEWIRDLTNDTIDHPNHLTQLVLGDVFAQTNSALGGSDYLGGISYSSDFTLNPYFISSPSLNFSGAVTTPSTAQVYINGQLTNQISLSPGQFTLNDLPVVTGAGNVQVVIRNALGQVQQLSYPYYYSNQLLQKGLEQFSYNLGFIRQGVGVSSWGYTSPAFIGYDEKGLTRWLTAGLNFEDGVGVVNGGPTFVFGLPIGQVILNLAGSTSSGYSGFGTFLGYSYQNRSIGLGFSLEDLSSHFANLSLSPQEDRPLLQETGTLSFPIKFLGDFSLSYSFLKDRDQGDSHSVSLQDIYTFPDGLGLFISGERTTPLQGQPENQFFVGLNFSFGRDSSGNVSMQEKNGQWTRSLEVQKSLPIGTGFGYNVQASEGTGSQASQFNGELDYQGPDGLYELIESDFGGQKTTQLNVSGGVVGIGGGLYPMQSVQEGFALVRVPGLKGVKVYFENQFIGKTNAQGELLIPRLLPYYNNKISIDLNDIPMNYEVRKNSELVAVPNRGGVLVVFPVYRFQMILGKIYLLWNQTPYIPQYGELSVLVDGKWKRSPVGGKGSYYFENIPPGNHRAYLKYNHHLYHFMFVVPESKKMTLRLSPELLPAPSLPCPVGFCRKAPKSVLGRKI